MDPTQLIYTGCFFKNNILLLTSLLETSIEYGKIDFNTTRFLVFTNKKLKQKILDLYKTYSVKGDVMILNKPICTMVRHSRNEIYKLEVAAAKLHIFDYPEIHKYKKILWLDYNTIISNNLNNIFAIDPKKKILSNYENKTGKDVHIMDTLLRR